MGDRCRSCARTLPVSKAPVPNPDDPTEILSCDFSVVDVPCPQCRAPEGVPCRGARWTSRQGRRWTRSTHWLRRDLAQRVGKGQPGADILLRRACENATMKPVDQFGHPVKEVP